MIKRVAAFLVAGCLLAWGAMAEEAQPAAVAGEFAAGAEESIRESGMQVLRSYTFDWNGLPLLADAENDALESLLAATRLETRRQGTEGSGYAGVDVLLQDVSVADMTMMTVDGVLYEQSNLLGGQTVAFTGQEFATFARRVSQRSEGALPTNLGWLFELTTMTLGGMDRVSVEAGTLGAVEAAYADWAERALTKEERQRPEVTLPGIYGARAVVTDVTRAEALALAEAVSAILAEEDSLWESAVRQQVGAENKVRETLQQITTLLQTLPQAAADYIPEGTAPGEYREVYGFGIEEALVARQLDIAVPGQFSLYLEWAPQERGTPPFHLRFSTEQTGFSILFTREHGAPSLIGNMTNTRHRYIAECALYRDDLRVSVVITRVENVDTMETSPKETRNIKTDYMFSSVDGQSGEEAIFTLTVEEVDIASGEGRGYERKHDWMVYLKGLGFDSRRILSISEKTTVGTEAIAISKPTDVVHPARLSDDSFDAWLADVNVYTKQVWFTILGRLPSDVAAYVLENYEIR